MKNMRKIMALFLSIVMLFSANIVFAENETISVTYDRAKYVAVTGNAGSENAGFDAALMLVKKNADYENLQLSDVGYIGQTEIDADGKYLFEFTFDGFTYENDVVNNYELLLNVNGEDKTETITQSKVTSELLSFDLDFDNFGEAVANIENTYGLKDVSYTLIVAFYDANDKLVGVKKEQKYTGDSNVLKYSYDDIPADASYARGFLWENTAFLLPLAPSGSYDIVARSENRNATMMCISPGIDETERNFAWYDVPNIGGAKIQVAEKVTGNASDFNGGNVKTFQAESGMLDTSKYNHLNTRPDNYDQFFAFADNNSWAKATVTGLEKGKEYVYRVGDKFGWFQKVYDFKTDAAPEDGFSFIVLTDEHFIKSKYQDVMVKNSNKAFEYCPNPSMVFTLGDNVDYPWHEDGYEMYFAREFTNEIPMVSVPGPTHDMGLTERKASVFGRHFNMPNQSETSGYIEGVGGNYWYTYGDVLFIALTDNWSSTAKESAEFVKEAVAANPDAKWKILYAHLPFGADGTGDPAPYFNAAGEDFINDSDIDMVMSGHLHRYYRTHQLINGEPVSTNVVNEVTDPEGVVYFSFNCSTATAESQTAAEHIAVYDDEAVYGWYITEDFHTYFQTVDVVTKDGVDTLEVKVYRNTFGQDPLEIKNTELIDSYKITKTK